MESLDGVVSRGKMKCKVHQIKIRGIILFYSYIVCI